MKPDHFQLLLKQHGLKVTKARTAILTSLHAAKSPLDVASVIEAVSKISRVDPATIYRSLEMMVSVNLIHRVNFEEGKFRYEFAQEHHHHLVCEGCSKIIPVYDQCITLAEAEIYQKYCFTVRRHTLEFFGLCQDCSRV